MKQKYKPVLVREGTHYTLMKLKAELRMNSMEAVIQDMLKNQDTRIFLAIQKNKEA
jgi:hypothetical protein